ncbi:MAG: hypothetical protein FVQ83_00065 [Chloroflexi bacterium]|nr:hypothetical protein [Chloroflexota bacterium]
MKKNLSPRILLSSFVLLTWLACGNLPETEEATGPTVAPPAGSAPTADYGDAPDSGPTNYPEPFAQTGNFPSLFSSDGARTLNIDEARLGQTASAELDADDPADPDGVQNLTNEDNDDGLVDFFILLTAIPPPTTMTVEVSAPEGSSGGTFYLNAIIDLNMDGEWGGRGANGELEWVVQNQPVQVTPGVTTPFTPPAFAFSNGNLLPDGAFMRLALTKEMVPPNWDGTGEFSAGEIEDHFIKLPEFGDDDDEENGGKTEGIPILSVNCGGPYKPGEIVTCNVFNAKLVAGFFTYTLRHTGPGTVGVPIATCTTPGGERPGGPVAIGPGVGVPITCNSTPGDAPDTWRLIARVKDPMAVVVVGGIHLGHSDISISEFGFEPPPKLMNTYVGAFRGSYIHYSGYSMVIVDFAIYADDPVPIEGASVTLQMTHPDGTTETQTVITGPGGAASAGFTIYVYGNYIVSVVNIEGEHIIYAPDMNVATSLEVDVGAGESIPVGPESTLVVQASYDILDFVERFNAAFAAGDVAALIELLHPAVIERYGADACEAYIPGVIENTIQVEVLRVSGFGLWDWELDEVSTSLDNIYTVLVNFTVQGQTTEQVVHYGQLEDGLLAWFTDCGDPLP